MIGTQKLKLAVIVLATSCSAFSLASCSAADREPQQGEETPRPYFGQEPPDLTPKVLAPGVVSTENWEYGGAFTPDLRQFYLLRSGGEYDATTFVVIENDNGTWRETSLSPRIGQPFISPDGQTMHLGKNYRTKTKNDWSDPVSLGEAFEQYRIMRLTSSKAGTYVFDEVGNDGDGVIRISAIVDGRREKPVPASATVNEGTWNAHPFIAPDESFILFDARMTEGFGDSDIYVSFKQQDGSWGKAQNLGDKINTEAWEAAASVTPDGKYLLFHRNVGSEQFENVDMFWVDADVINDLRPE